jgi:site-specific DNA recombinase
MPADRTTRWRKNPSRSRQVSFVSITQQFNTTTSMGRLTLNILLSFAQFEREVTGERIRDKIAALKSVHALRDELADAGIKSKRRTRPDGAEYGGQKFSRGALYLILQNRLYRGEIPHKGNSYPGEHPAINRPCC